MNRDIVYDSQLDRLVFFMGAPDQEYWEGLWGTMITRDVITQGDRFVTMETQKRLEQGARVIDAGCGICATVYGLAKAGYDAEGIDYAENTLARIRELVPELNVRQADVRDLPYSDNSLDGEWSLGVIEHFYDGFAPLIAEKHRVLRPGGYLLLTVPLMSPLKSLKVSLGLTPAYDKAEREKFFQFGLWPSFVIERISASGFTYLGGYGRSGALGSTEDFPTLGRMLFLNPHARSLPTRAWWRLVDKIVTPISQHTRFFLFQKADSA